MQSAIQFLDKLWAQLTQPSPEIKEIDQRHQVRTLTGLLLLLELMGWCSFVPMLLFDMQSVVESPVNYVVVPILMLLILMGVLLLSRTRHYWLAAVLCISIVSMVIFFLAAPSNGQPIVVTILNFLIVPLMLSSILFSQWMVGLLVIVYLAGILLAYNALQAFPVNGDVPLYLIMMAGGTTMLIARYRNALEADRRAVLEASAARYRLLVDRSPYAILVCQGDTITFCNEAGGRLLGAGIAARVVGQPVWALVDPANEDQLRAYLDTVREDAGTAPPLEIAARRADAKPFEAELTGLPLHDILSYEAPPHDSPGLSLLLVVRDVTEHRNVEQQRLALAMERQRVKMVTDFISDVSHEFRTPLSVINATQYLLEHQTAPERQPEHFAILREQVDAIVRLVDSMLTMTRLDSGVPLDYASLDVNGILYDLHTSQILVAEEKQIDLRFDLAPDLPLVQANRTELHRALANLLENALHFTPSRGQVRLKTTANTRYILVDVSDTGIGIEPDALPHIFESMYRGDGARTERAAGLGLSIARKIIALHGGRIEVESAPGKGTTFHVYLPKAQ